MYAKMLAQSNTNLESLKQEKAFLTGNIFYFYNYLPCTNSNPQIIEDATKEIINYLSEVLTSVNLEWEIMNAVNRYLYSLCNDWISLEKFDKSPEFPLFKGIFDLLSHTYSKRVKEYMWYLSNYKSYIEINRIGKNYKIISRQGMLPQEKYLELLKNIPKVQ